MCDDSDVLAPIAEHVVAVGAVLARAPPLIEPVEQWLAHPRRARIQQAHTIPGAGERRVHHDAVGIVDVERALEGERAVHFAAQRPAEAVGDRPHLVQGAFPLGHQQAGLLLHLARETREHADVAGVDHASRRAPVHRSVSPAVLDEEESGVRLHEGTGDGELMEPHGGQSRAYAKRLDTWRTRSRMPHQVTRTSASTTMRIDIFDRPRVRSRKAIGISTILQPACWVR